MALLALAALLAACEKEFVPDTPPGAEQLVVEGYIEAGDRPTPPYVILTRNVPFFTEFKANELSDLFVHDARVQVSDGTQTVDLTELCLAELTPEQRELAATFLGFEADSVGFNFCAYVDLSGRLTGQEGKTYTLLVEAEGRTLRATTTTPLRAELDSLRFLPPPGEPNDTLAQLRCVLADPPGVVNYYRYMTSINGGSFLAGLNSVFEDRLFDGERFEFPLPKSEPRGAEFDPATFGLYRLGDTVTIKWATIDKTHYDFWNTLEFNASNQGPFSSYTRIASNVEGGLGIWGGLTAAYYTRLVDRTP